MPWNDDSWRDSYDEWKLRSPYDEYDECYHEDYDIDLLSGRCHCNRCSESWSASAEEMQAAFDHEREYAEWVDKQHRRELRLKLTLWSRWPLFRLLEKVWPRKAGRVLDDSEVPF